MESHKLDFKLEDIILGGQDGLVNVLGVILGVAAASGDTRLVVAAGLSATFAESISMAAVAYTNQNSKADHYQSELNRETREIEEIPGAEVEEVREIYVRRGFEGELLKEVVAKIVSDRRVWLEVMMGEELGLVEIKREKILSSSLLVGLSAIVGSLIPLLPFFFFPISSSIGFSLILSILALLVLGAYKAKETVGRPLKSGVEMAAIGTVSALTGYLVGLIFKAPAQF